MARRYQRSLAPPPTQDSVSPKEGLSTSLLQELKHFLQDALTAIAGAEEGEVVASMAVAADTEVRSKV